MTMHSDNGLPVPVTVVKDYGDVAEVIPHYWMNYPEPDRAWWKAYHAAGHPEPTVLASKSQLKE
jgi:hypothetical protein